MIGDQHQHAFAHPGSVDGENIVRVIRSMPFPLQRRDTPPAVRTPVDHRVALDVLNRAGEALDQVVARNSALQSASRAAEQRFESELALLYAAKQAADERCTAAEARIRDLEARLSETEQRLAGTEQRLVTSEQSEGEARNWLNAYHDAVNTLFSSETLKVAAAA